MSIWSMVESAMGSAGPMSARQVAAATFLPLQVVRNALGQAAKSGRVRAVERVPRPVGRGAPEVLYSLCHAPAEPSPHVPPPLVGGLTRSALQRRSPLEVAWAGAACRGAAA